LPSLLAPGGRALLTEYGSLDKPPSPVQLPGHVEYSIHFGRLQAAARAAGFRARVVTLTELLGFDRSVEMLSANSHCLLATAAEKLYQRELPSLALDRAHAEALAGELFRSVDRLEFVRVDDENAFMSPETFLALVLER
jgi:hypothetical protein